MHKTRSFPPLEITKMLKQIKNALAKINKVCDNLEKAGDIKNLMLLFQSAQSIMRVHQKLEGKPHKSRKRLLEKAKRILAEKSPPMKIPIVGIWKKFC